MLLEKKYLITDETVLEDKPVYLECFSQKGKKEKNVKETPKKANFETFCNGSVQSNWHDNQLFSDIKFVVLQLIIKTSDHLSNFLLIYAIGKLLGKFSRQGCLAN